MKKKSTADFISEVKENGNAKCWAIQKVERDFDENPLSEEIISPVFFSLKEAKEFLADYSVEPEFGTSVDAMLFEYEPNSEDLCYFEDYETEEEESLNEELARVLEELLGDLVTLEEFYYDYKSLDGAVLVFWSWQTYVGYARKIIEIRDGDCDDDERLLIPVDHSFRTQCSVLIPAEDAENLSVEERRDLIERKILEDKLWKWQNNPQRAIDDYMSNYEED